MNKLIFSWPNGKAGALTTSWDDGTVHDRRLVAIFNKYGIKGTFNLNSGFLTPKAHSFNKRNYISAKEVNRLFKNHEIAVHTANHPFLWRSPDSMIFSEIIEDRRALERLAGYPVRGMALPFGGPNDERVKKALKDAGILYCRPVFHIESFELPSDLMYWHSTCHQSTDFVPLWDKFLKNPNPEKLFYLWGHSYEFPRDNNWDRMKEFGELTGKRKDIWYATNMQIYDYVTAWRNLSCSVEMQTMENKSATEVWFKTDGKLRKIEPGQIVKL